LAARRLSRFHLEIGEGDTATGKGDTVLLAPAVLFKLRFLGKRSGEAHLALGATAGPAGVIHLDSVGFRQFQEGQGLVRLDRPVALDEVDTVPWLGQRQRLGVSYSVLSFLGTRIVRRKHEAAALDRIRLVLLLTNSGHLLTGYQPLLTR